MFCTNCGNKLDQGDNFCGNCGKGRNHVISPESENLAPKVVAPVISESVTKQEAQFIPPVTTSRNKTAEAKAEKRREELRSELKRIMEKERKREVTDSELFEAENWMRGYASLLLDLGVKEAKLQKKLEQNPQGFHLEGKGYSCFICGVSISNEQTWYDKFGIKCLVCQAAINKKIIPATAASNRDHWYNNLDFERSFFINRFGLRRLVKEGLLKPRIVPSESGRTHYQLFFIKDHKGVLPPKKNTDWPMVKFQKDGKDWYRSEPWFYHANPEEVLKGYKILDYIKTLKEHEIERSYPNLSFQLHPGMGTFYKVNHITKKEPEEKGKQ